MLTLGDAFTQIVYGQLILENARIYGIDEDTIDQIFEFMVRDLSKHALTLYGKASSTAQQMEYCLKMIRKPATRPGPLCENVFRAGLPAQRRV